MIKEFLVFIVVVLVLVGFVLLPATGLIRESQRKQLSAYSNEWSGIAEFKKLLEDKKYNVMGIVTTPLILSRASDPTHTLYIALGIEKPYKDAEIEAINEFVNRGGRVIIADDSTNANSLSYQYGVMFYGATMWDEIVFKNESYPVVNASVELINYKIILNKPTGLKIEENRSYDIIAKGSEYSYVDLNNNGRIDIPPRTGEKLEIGDRRGEVLVGVSIPVKKGQIVFMADPSIFIGNMLEYESFTAINWRTKETIIVDKDVDPLIGGTNRDFVLSLVNILIGDGGTVLIDEGRHEQSTYDVPMYTVVETTVVLTSSFAQTIFTFLGIFLILIVIIFIARDKESWIHRFDIGGIKRRDTLPETGKEQTEMLRKAMYQKLRIQYSLSHDELSSLGQNNVIQMVGDPQLVELITNKDKIYTSEEIKVLTNKLRMWGK